MSKETFTRTSRNSAWLLSGQAGAQALSLAFTVLVARGLGTGPFGQYVFGAAVASFLTIAASFGLDLLVIRSLARDPGRTSEVFSSAVVIRLLLWIAGMAVLVAVIGAGSPDPTTVQILALLSLAGLATLLGNCGAAVMASRELFWPRVAAEGSGNVLRVVLAYAAVRTGFGVVGVAGAVLVASVAGAALSVGYTVRRYRIRPVVVPRGALLVMLRKAAPFGAAGLVFSLYFRLHLILLSLMRGDVDAGLYGAAFKAVDAWILVPGSLTGAAYPVLARSFGRGGRVFERTGAVLTRGLLAVGLAVGALIAANSSELIELIFGQAYMPAGRALEVLAFFLPLIALNYVLGTILYAAGEATAVLRAELTGLIVGLACGLLLIPRFGITGAALSAVGMELMVVLHNAGSVRRRLGLSPVPDALWPALPAAAIVGLLFRLVSFPVIGELAVGLVLFGLLFLILGGMRAADRAWLAENVPGGSLRALLSRIGLLADRSATSPAPLVSEGTRKVSSG